MTIRLEATHFDAFWISWGYCAILDTIQCILNVILDHFGSLDLIAGFKAARSC